MHINFGARPEDGVPQLPDLHSSFHTDDPAVLDLYPKKLGHLADPQLRLQLRRPVGDTCRISGGTHAPDYSQPVSYCVPTSIAPAGLTFSTGTRFPEWQNSVFMGALAGTALWRVALNDNQEASREKLFESLGQRIRCVKLSPNGWLYLLTDGGQLIRIEC